MSTYCTMLLAGRKLGKAALALLLGAGLFAGLGSFAGCGSDDGGPGAAPDAAADGRECFVDAECDDENPCTVDSCTSGACSTGPAPDGDAEEQTDGDCKRTVCTGGVRSDVADSGDPADDGEDCTLDSCVNGAAVHKPKLEDSPCRLGGGSGTCKSGRCLVLCTPTTARTQCNDNKPCTEDACLPCTAAECAGKGMCVNQGLSGMASPGAPQKTGDCHERRCVEGEDEDVVDNYDVPNDGKECTRDVCNAGIPVNEPLPAGTECTSSSDYVCDGAGKCVQCLTVADCTLTPSPCATPSCENGSCTRTPLPAGTPVPESEQTPGDCRRATCDGTTGYTYEPDPNDLVDDDNPCTTDRCVGTALERTRAPAGTTCGTGRICTSSGSCCQPTTCAAAGRTCGTYSDGCGTTLNCGTCDAGDTCTSGQCGCRNGSQTGTETDVDCGGPCAPCTQGKRCSTNTDCATGFCTDGVCCNDACAGACKSCVATQTGQPSGTCSNVYDSTDPGNECTASGTVCGATGQCKSGACEYPAAGTACGPSSCASNIETRADTCNGSGTCTDNGTAACAAPYTCGSSACQGCADGSMNGSETDVDCGGGGACQDCAIGKRCNAGTDCTTGFCVDGVCCNNDCSGLCRACNLTNPGTCTNLPNGADPINECSGPRACNGAGACN
jgi:hypothetical protein